MVYLYNFCYVTKKCTTKFLIDTSFYRYVKQHKRHQLNIEPNLNYLGHPINAYHLIRHVVYGWEYISHHLSLLSDRRHLQTGLGKDIMMIRYSYTFTRTHLMIIHFTI